MYISDLNTPADPLPARTPVTPPVYLDIVPDYIDMTGGVAKVTALPPAYTERLDDEDAGGSGAAQTTACPRTTSGYEVPLSRTQHQYYVNSQQAGRSSGASKQGYDNPP